MKVLIVRFSSIGDIVLTSPVVRCLKKQLNAELHYITKSSYKSLLEHNPYIDRIFTIDKSIDEVLPELKNENYDVIIDLHHNVRTLSLKKKLKVKSYAFPKENINKWLLVNLKIDKMPDVHIVDRYFETTRELGVKNDQAGLDYFIPKEDEVSIDSLPDFLNNGFLVYAIGGQYEGKKLPKERILELCGMIEQPMIILGGKEDADIGEELEKKYDHVYNACGKYSLNGSASIASQAKVVITHDTGLMHMASAFKKKIISLWGCTTPNLGMYPYLPDPASIIIEPDHLKNRPCSKLGNKCKNGDFQCSKEIDLNRVVESVNELYN